MISLHGETAERLGLGLIVYLNQEGIERGIDPISSGSSLHALVLKTEAVKRT
jgi:sulfate adenylyltransferase subunit 2